MHSLVRVRTVYAKALDRTRKSVHANFEIPLTLRVPVPGEEKWCPKRFYEDFIKPDVTPRGVKKKKKKKKIELVFIL